MNLIKKILKRFHRCNFNNPIVSMYLSFNQRNIIYECKCGKRKDFVISIDFSRPFPIETTNHLSFKEFKDILNKNGLAENRIE